MSVLLWFVAAVIVGYVSMSFGWRIWLVAMFVMVSLSVVVTAVTT